MTAPHPSKTVLAVCAVLAVAAFGSCARQPEPSLSSVVLITLDTLRGDHLHCYGYPRETSPGIDSLAAAGVRFQRVYAHMSSTGPSHASLFTSLYPPAHGLVRNGMRLAEDVPVWAELLRDQGFTTAGFTNVYPFRQAGLWRGFDTMSDTPDELARDFDDLVFAWADSARTDRFFLWIHLFIVHSPYRPPREYRSAYVDPAYAGRLNGSQGQIERVWRDKVQLTESEVEHLVNLYDAEIRYCDDKIMAVLAGLRERSLLDDALVVLTSDHGDLFSHGIYGKHEPSIYDGTLRVPLILGFPDGRHAGRELESNVVELIDVLPTVFEVLGVPAPAGVHGRSLMPLVRGDDRTARADSAAFAMRAVNYDPQLSAVITPAWKLVMPATGEPELYAITEDPGETRDLAAERPAEVQALRKELARWATGFAHQAEGVDITDPATLELLRTLGYVD